MRCYICNEILTEIEEYFADMYEPTCQLCNVIPEETGEEDERPF